MIAMKNNEVKYMLRYFYEKNLFQRQMKLQKERLTEQFSDALKSFQTVQRTAAEKERASISRARAASGNNYVSKLSSFWRYLGTVCCNTVCTLLPFGACLV